jgi:hypothetical protein
MLGWEDRPSKLSVGDYVFVYNSETDTIETCFEINHYPQIKILFGTKRAICHHLNLHINIVGMLL